MKEAINYDDFSKLDIRMGLIKKAERIEESEKLILLSIDLGEAEDRQLVAGIGASYDPEELKGKAVPVLSNLEPKKIMGYESNGMILASESEKGPVILTALSDTVPGSRVS